MLIFKGFQGSCEWFSSWYENKQRNGLILYEDEHRVLTIDDATERQELEHTRHRVNIANHRTPLIVASREGNHEQLLLLLKAGADPLEPDRSGWTALHEAAHQGRAETVELLLQFGMDVEVMNPRYRITPIHQAAFSGNPQVIRILHQYGADLNRRTLPATKVPRGDSALLRAKRMLSKVDERRLQPEYSAEFEKVYAQFLLERDHSFLPTVDSCTAVVDLLIRLEAVE